jgi:hypothetical protein
MDMLIKELGITREAAAMAMIKGCRLSGYIPETLLSKVQQLKQIVDGSPWSIDGLVAADPELLGEQ